MAYAAPARPPAAGRPREILSIQYLRGFAAIAVVLFHEIQWIQVFRLGSHGVDVFFVISGFIMFALTHGRAITPKRFILDRLARIGPPYWLATAIVFLLAVFHVRFFGVSTNIVLLVKSLLFIPADNGGGHVWPILLVGWTLNYEMFFYVMFFCALFIAPAQRLIVLTVGFLGLMFAGRLLHVHGPILATYTSPLLAEFIAGVWLASIFGASLDKRPIKTMLIHACGLIATMILLSIVFHSIWFSAIAVTIVAAGLSIERLGLLPKVSLLKTFGDASFSIYLFQGFAFESVGWLFATLSAGTRSPWFGRTPEHLVGVVAAVVLGIVAYAIVERPLTKAVRSALASVLNTPVGLREPAAVAAAEPAEPPVIAPAVEGLAP